MATTKHTLLILALVFALTVPVISDESQISNTRNASCMVRITVSSDILNLSSDEMFEALFYGSSVYGKTIQQVLNFHPRTRPDVEIDVDIDFLSGYAIIGNDEFPIEDLTIPSGSSQTIVINLSVSLPNSVGPVAEEFLDALVNNLRYSLSDIYNELHSEKYSPLIRTAERNSDEAKIEYEGAMQELEERKENIVSLDFEPSPVSQQLEQIVDLSQLTPEMTFEEVLNELKFSVEPPLQIQPNWRALSESMAAVDRTTTAEMEPLSGIKLGKALELLVAGLSVEEEIGYVVDEEVIIIAPEESLPFNDMVTEVYDVSCFLNSAVSIENLMYAIQDTIEYDSWYDLNEEAEGFITPVLGNKLSIYNTPETHQEIIEFLQSLPIEIPAEPVVETPTEDLIYQRQNLSRDKFSLEMEIARLEARKTAIEEQIAEISAKALSETKDDIVITELEQLLENQMQNLEEVELQVRYGTVPQTAIADAQEKVSRAKIEIAQRQEEIAQSAGGDQLANLNKDLSIATIALMEQQAGLMVVEKQLTQINNQLNTVSTDPTVERAREAKKALTEAEERLEELREEERSSMPPSVIVIGAN